VTVSTDYDRQYGRLKTISSAAAKKPSIATNGKRLQVANFVMSSVLLEDC